MSFAWREYLILAKDLMGESGPKPSEEARSRTAISRAYYSVYHRSKYFIQNIESLPVGKESLHGWIKRWYFEKGEKSDPMQIIAKSFSRLKTARTEADYNEHSSNCNCDKAIQVILISEDLMRRLDEISKNIQR